MPFTPFHFGPGLFGKSLAARRFSWVSFIASQIVIDCEPLYYHLRNSYPVHHFFHTFVGGAIAGLLTGFLLIVLLPLRRLTKDLPPTLQSEFSSVGLMVGAIFGGLSHPFLDGLMHSDVRPFAPWREDNPLLGLVNVETLHQACVALGVLGVIVIVGRLRNEN